MTSKNTKTFEFRLGKTALILFVMGMSCLVFVAFVGGVLVGKHIDTYPEKIARGIPAKIVGGEGKPPAAAPAQSPLSASAVPAAKVPPRPASATPVVEAPAAAETRPQQVAESGKEGRPSASGPGAAAEKAVSPGKKSAMKERGAAKTAPGQAPTAATAPADVKGEYLLQVASYKDKEKAEQVAGRLGAMGYAPRVVATDLREKGIWYRVQVSGFATREEAQRASEAIAAKMSGVRSAVKPSLKGN
jgi:cell division protein FtsN